MKKLSYRSISSTHTLVLSKRNKNGRGDRIFENLNSLWNRGSNTNNKTKESLVFRTSEDAIADRRAATMASMERANYSSLPSAVSSACDDVVYIGCVTMMDIITTLAPGIEKLDKSLSMYLNNLPDSSKYLSEETYNILFDKIVKTIDKLKALGYLSIVKEGHVLLDTNVVKPLANIEKIIKLDNCGRAIMVYFPENIEHPYTIFYKQFNIASTFIRSIVGGREHVDLFFQQFGIKALVPFPEVVSAEIKSFSVSRVSGYDQRSGEYSYRRSNISEDSARVEETGFYPYLAFTGGSEKFFDDFLKSSAPVLVLIGPPGTGKSTFSRTCFLNKQLNIMTANKPSIVFSDRFLDNFADSDSRVLLLEDADEFIRPRSDGNAFMSDLLNITEGIDSIGNKKIIFSTNLNDVSGIDQALVRSGRCFCVLEFRNLTRAEADVVQKAHFKDTDCLQDVTTKKEWSLADILNPPYDGVVSKRTKAVAGFL